MGRLFFRASLLAAVAGCQAVSPPPVQPPRPAAPVIVRPVAPAAEPPPVRTVARPAEPPLAEEAELPAAPDALSLAADCLDRGDFSAAAGHLEKHVRQFPDQVIFRAQLGDLLVRLDRLPDAQAQFETVTAQAQDGPPIVRNELVHYHTRLMEIGVQRADEYAEYLHRGIGLYLVAVGLEKREADPADVERLLCKAAKALKDAQDRRPDDARAAWYLYRVWNQLDQPRPAAKALRQALAAAPFSALTPAEARELAVAGRAEVVVK